MSKTAQLYRMATDQHLCPFGLKSRDLLRRKGYTIEDHPLTSREATDAFKREHEVTTTPQTFIDGTRVGGYSDLRKHFKLPSETSDGVTYTPVIAIFATALLTAAALSWRFEGSVVTSTTLMAFIALSMIVLAIQKLRDLTAFSNQFITYDLLAMRRVRYAYVYPFAEAYAGIGMLAGLPAWSVAPVALFIGGIGAASVIKAVYIDHRALKCACVGGNSNVPLGFVSLTENLFMIFAAGWMLLG